MIPLFQNLDFETISNCNRTCPTCIRNSHPDRDAVQPWFETHLLDEDIIFAVLDEAVSLGFSGGVILSHYNEPLMDERLPDIARRVKAYNRFASIFLNTNGDFLTEEMASAFDGVLDHMIVALYMDEPVKSKRAAWMATLFKKTQLSIITNPVHIATHFSPNFPVIDLARQHAQHTCMEPWMHVILNHRAQWLGCCDDVIGNFGLGTYPEMSLKYHLEGKHQIMRTSLAKPGGRAWHSYCVSCPRA